MNRRTIPPFPARRAESGERPLGAPLSAVLLVVALSLPACDTGKIGGPGEPSEARAVLADSLPRVFAERDDAAYERLLHPDYRFTFAAGDAPADLPGSFWGKKTESAVVESLFSHAEIQVLDFDIAIFDDAFTLIPGTSGERDYRAGAILGAAIVRQDTAGGTIDTVIVPVIETYRLRVDPADGSWKIYDEIEQGPAGKTAGASAETSRWGALKAAFYAPLPLPAERTVKGIVRLDDEAGTPLEGATVEAGTEKSVTDAYGAFSIPGVPPSVTSLRASHASALPAVIPVGGGDDVFRVDIALRALLLHETPGAMLERDFAAAYSTRDSLRYAFLLDSRYRFTPLLDEIDPDDPLPYWTLDEEHAIAGRMFAGTANSRGQIVKRIKLVLDVKTSAVDDTPDPERPPGEIWHRTTTFVDLLVTVDDPEDPEGIMHYVVLSDQVFIARPDPARAGRYLVVRQEDRHPINRMPKGPSRGTEETSWGRIKSLWR